MTDEEQEAGSHKYAFGVEVLPLSTGRFAIFGKFSNDKGLPLLKIVNRFGLADEIAKLDNIGREEYRRRRQEEEARRISLASQKPAARQPTTLDDLI